MTFAYDGSYVNVFENVSFDLDTDWRLGLVGRNGRGKTTLMRILTSELDVSGSVYSPVKMDYFSCSYPMSVLDAPQEFVSDTNVTGLEFVRSRIAPFTEWERTMESLAADGSNAAIEEYGRIFELYTANDGYTIDEIIRKESSLLRVSSDALERPVTTLSGGELTKLAIGAMFLRKSTFRLIDEPTNHLDYHGRESLAEYLSGRGGFIVISHDRAFLDMATDHTMSINKDNIEITRGNYSVWKEQKDRRDAYEIAENDRLKKDIARLNESVQRAAGFADEAEGSKWTPGVSDRGFLGHKSAKMMKRAKNIERRMTSDAQEKTELLKNIEQSETLKMNCVPYHSKIYAEADKLCAGYRTVPIDDCDENCSATKFLFSNVSFTITEGDIVHLKGVNGSGKSTLIKLLLGHGNNAIHHTGRFRIGSSLAVSYVPQDTSFLHGTISDFIATRSEIDHTLYMTILRKLDFTRSQFDVRLEDMSSGQKKKILLAASLCEKAALYIWDEPLNFVDVLSRIQIEELLLQYRPTILFVEHDAAFVDSVATRRVVLPDVTK